MYMLNVQVTAYGRQTVTGTRGWSRHVTYFLGLQSYHWNGWT